MRTTTTQFASANKKKQHGHLRSVRRLQLASDGKLLSQHHNTQRALHFRRNVSVDHLLHLHQVRVLGMGGVSQALHVAEFSGKIIPRQVLLRKRAPSGHALCQLVQVPECK